VDSGKKEGEQRKRDKLSLRCSPSFLPLSTVFSVLSLTSIVGSF
jgi:hypothetical protein